MRRFIPFIALGIGAYLAFLISSFPADTAVRWFAPPAVRTNNVTGTIWSGSAELASVENFAMRDLRWQIDALPLLLARLGGTAQARISGGFADAQFLVAGERIELANLQMSTTLAALAEALPVSGASGALNAQLATLELERMMAQINSQQIEVFWPVNASGTIRISDLLVEPYAGLGTTLIPLGSYELEFVPGDETLTQAQIRDLGGPLEFNGTLDLSPSGEYALDGQIMTREGAPESLVQGLNFMAEDPGNDGRRRIYLTGSL